MNNIIDMKKLEKNTFLDTNQDGFIELILGIFYFGIAGYIGTKTFPILLIMLPIFAPIWMKLVRNKFTYPRIGYATPINRSTKTIIQLVFSYLLFVICFVIIIPLLININNIQIWDNLVQIMLGIATFILFAGIGYITTSLRYYRLSVLSFSCLVIVSIVEFDDFRNSIELFFLLMSGILMISGIVLFINFIKKIPINDMEDVHEAETKKNK